ncbi:MAG: hypothetical protein GXY49_10350, partial [Syntrophomonadaceae bacterium]|nr:hypothetical protein [Syntrophomonadaceae bacterium]
IYELTEQHFDQITRASLKRVEQMKSASLEEILQESLLSILRAEDRGKLNLYLLQEAVIENPTLRKRFASKYRDFESLMGQYLDMVAPDLNADKARILARVYVAILDGLIIQWLLEPEAIQVQEIANLLASVLKQG